jgi:hypothetical protein
MSVAVGVTTAGVGRVVAAERLVGEVGVVGTARVAVLAIRVGVAIGMLVAVGGAEVAVAVGGAEVAVAAIVRVAIAATDRVTVGSTTPVAIAVDVGRPAGRAGARPKTSGRLGTRPTAPAAAVGAVRAAAALGNGVVPATAVGVDGDSRDGNRPTVADGNGWATPVGWPIGGDTAPASAMTAGAAAGDGASTALGPPHAVIRVAKAASSASQDMGASAP